MMRSLRIPHTLVLLFGMMVAAWAATWIVPAGQFAVELNERGREVVVAGTYERLAESPRLSPLALLTVVPRALKDTADIIFFVLIIGGALSVLRATAAIEAGLGRMLQKLGHRPELLIFLGMAGFATASSTLGMAEEYVPLVLLLIGLCAALRLDTIAAVATMVVGYGIGYGVAALNPFTLQVAQQVAGVELTSGWPFRVALTVPLLLVGYLYVLRYARRVQADPAASLVADIPEAQPPAAREYPPLELRHALVLAAVVATVVLMVWGIWARGWYLEELGALFLGLALFTGLVGGLGADETARRFIAGAAELAGTALLIGFARSIALLLEDGLILHTIVHALAAPLSLLGAHLAAVGMLLVQSALNLFIPSGSGQAYATMPLLAPVGDLVGVSRQVSVLAFQMGDGLMNMIVPTNAILMGILGIAGIPYDRWFRFIWPLLAMLLGISALALMLAVTIGYS